MIYWADMLSSVGAGWTLFSLAVCGSHHALSCFVATIGAILALMRALAFLHEISHGRSPRFFQLAWNVAVGIPMGVPSIMYVGSHPEHHRVDRFATELDPEYAPIAEWGGLRRTGFVLTGLFVPALLTVRWGILAPLGVLGGRLRTAVLERCSTLVINPGYARRAATRPAPRDWLPLECASTLFVWTVAGLALCGAIPVAFVIRWFIVVGGVFALNQIRTLVAHGYTNFGSSVDLDGQFRDSINLAPSPAAALIAPLGLRYHALHHLMPELPYHALGRVHRALCEGLGPGSPYRTAPGGGISRAFRLLFQGP